MVQSQKLTTQPEPQKIELNNAFMPFQQLEGLEVKKIPQSFQGPTFELDGVGKIVFRFSDSLPDQPKLDSQRYVWAEIAFDAGLENAKIENLVTAINLIFIRAYGERHLGNGKVNQERDRLKFDRFARIIGQQGHRTILPKGESTLKPFSIKNSEIPSLKSVITDNRNIRTPYN